MVLIDFHGDATRLIRYAISDHGSIALLRYTHC